MQENKRAIRFALIICIISSGLISFAAQYLKPFQEANVKLDKMKNIVKALNIKEAGKESVEDYYNTIESATITKLYNENIVGAVVTGEGDIVEGVKPTDLKEDDTSKRAIYLHKSNDGTTLAYCLPIQGKGLWSTIYGYLALDSDVNHIRGVTFYQHGETPGLGGEIDKDWFVDNYKGKEILNENDSIVSVKIVKGKARKSSPTFEHEVDGISGATLTCKGVNEFMKKDLDFFAPYIKKIRATLAQPTTVETESVASDSGSIAVDTVLTKEGSNE